MNKKTWYWIFGFFLILVISGSFIPDKNLSKPNLELGDPTYSLNTRSSPQTENEFTPISTESSSSSKKSSSSKSSEEKTCDGGYADEYKCDGKVIRRKWISYDCSFDWFYFSTCNYNCEDGTCVGEPVREPEEQSDSLKVTYIADGDTLDINTGERVRLICIDTPERGEYYYDEAKDYLRSLTLNKEVDLVKDVSETDRYGRLLRYIYLTDGTFVNELLVENGYAKAYPYGSDTTLCPQIQEAEQYAKDNNLGIWDVEEEQEEQSSEDYICTYDYYNCGDFYSCSEVIEVFNSCSNDIHKLDRDDDGIPCESLCG